MKKMNFITRFLCSCAGCDIATLLQCNSAEQRKMAIIGSCVLITPMLGVASGTFAMLTFSKNLWLSLGFGLLWGFVIFLIERAVVANTRPGEFNMGVLARLTLACIFALVIAVPMELKVFEDAIKEKLANNLNGNIKGINADYDVQIENIKTQLNYIKLELLQMSDINQTPQTVEQTDEPKPVDVSASTENTTDKESSSFQYSNSHVTMDRKPFKYDIPKKYKNVKPLTSFGLSNVNLDKLETPNVNLIKQADDNWIQAYGHAYEDGIAGTIINKQDIDLEKAMNCGEWRQSIDYNGFKCAMDIPRVEPHTSGDKLTGTAAAAHIDAIIGGAKFIRIPLWASGFWITITTPAINELLNLRISDN